MKKKFSKIMLGIIAAVVMPSACMAEKPRGTWPNREAERAYHTHFGNIIYNKSGLIAILLTIEGKTPGPCLNRYDHKLVDELTERLIKRYTETPEIASIINSAQVGLHYKAILEAKSRTEKRRNIKDLSESAAILEQLGPDGVCKLKNKIEDVFNQNGVTYTQKNRLETVAEVAKLLSITPERFARRNKSGFLAWVHLRRDLILPILPNALHAVKEADLSLLKPWVEQLGEEKITSMESGLIVALGANNVKYSLPNMKTIASKIHNMTGIKMTTQQRTDLRGSLVWFIENREKILENLPAALEELKAQNKLIACSNTAYTRVFPLGAALPRQGPVAPAPTELGVDGPAPAVIAPTTASPKEENLFSFDDEAGWNFFADNIDDSYLPPDIGF